MTTSFPQRSLPLVALAARRVLLVSLGRPFAEPWTPADGRHMSMWRSSSAEEDVWQRAPPVWLPSSAVRGPESSPSTMAWRCCLCLPTQSVPFGVFLSGVETLTKSASGRIMDRIDPPRCTICCCHRYLKRCGSHGVAVCAANELQVIVGPPSRQAMCLMVGAHHSRLDHMDLSWLSPPFLGDFLPGCRRLILRCVFCFAFYYFHHPLKYLEGFKSNKHDFHRRRPDYKTAPALLRALHVSL